VDWWILALVSSSVPALFLLLMLFMPESPNYLMQKKDKINASKALQWLRGTISHDDVSKELNEVIFCSKNCLHFLNSYIEIAQKIQLSIESFDDVSIRYYAKRAVLLPIGISLALMLFQQWNGNVWNLITISFNC
jgi:hypothetical protein